MRAWLLLAILVSALLLGWVRAGGAVELPGGHVLVRDAVSDDGRTVAALAPPGDRCWRVRLFALREGRWVAFAEHAGPPRPADGRDCPPVVAALAGNGRTLAVHSPWEGRLQMLELAGSRLVETGRVTLPGTRGKSFPSPGALVALQRDGSAVLVGAPNYDCVVAVPEDLCGLAHLFVRKGRSWQEELRFPRPAEAAPTDRFGQTVALSGDGRVALVGGPGSYGRAGRLHVYARATDGGWDLLDELVPPEPTDLEFGQEVAISDDGSVIAAGAEEKVVLYRRRGDTWPRVATAAVRDPLIGTFGGSVALSGAGTVLVVGAPRSACPHEPTLIRCGAVRVFDLDRRGGAIELGPPSALEPVVWLPKADFGWRVATDAAGRLIAVQGRLAHLYAR